MGLVIGQEKAVKLLESSLKQGTPAHAYLLVGPAHVGKTTLALNLAQALNCSGFWPPCGQCPACSRIASFRHSDVQVVRPTPDEKTGRPRVEIGIDQIREVVRSAQLPPYEGRYKVFIIQGAEHLTSDAANCFLKTLEEPPPYIVFVLLAEKEGELLPTVASRCQRLELCPLPLTQVEAVLAGQGVEPERTRWLARLSQGCVGWALQAQAEPQILQSRQARLSRFQEMLGASYEERFAYAAELAGQFEKDQEGVARTLELWKGWWRDLLLLKGGYPQGVLNIDHMSTMEKFQDISLGHAMTALRHLDAATYRLQHNVQPRLALEVLMLSLPCILVGKEGGLRSRVFPEAG